MSISQLNSLSSQFAALADTAGFDRNKDFHKQEIQSILDTHKDNPDFNLLALVKEHCCLRGFGEPLGERLEHDMAHVVIGMVFHEDMKEGNLKPEEQSDFQTGRYIEVFANDIEQKISPNGTLATWHRQNPDAFNASPFHPALADIAQSVEGEENYVRTLCWIIGGHTQQRAANIRYVNADARVELENIVENLGYETSFEINGDSINFAVETPIWSIKAPDGTIYSCLPDCDPVLPSGSNGIEDFQSFKFPDEERIKTIYKRAEPAIDLIKQTAEDKTMEQALQSIKVEELISVIQKTTVPETLVSSPPSNKPT